MDRSVLERELLEVAAVAARLARQRDALAADDPEATELDRRCVELDRRAAVLSQRIDVEARNAYAAVVRERVRALLADEPDLDRSEICERLELDPLSVVRAQRELQRTGLK